MFESGNTVNPIPIKYDWFIQVQLISQFNLLGNDTSKTAVDEVVYYYKTKIYLCTKWSNIFGGQFFVTNL